MNVALRRATNDTRSELGEEGVKRADDLRACRRRAASAGGAPDVALEGPLH